MHVSDLPDPRRHWRDDAACAGRDQRIWFPFHDDRKHLTDWDELDTLGPSPYHAARVICAGCPVRQECLDFALEMHEQHGMWGGLAPRERQKITRSRGYRNQIPPTVRTCDECDATFVALHNSERLCSDDCRRNRDRAAHRRYLARKKEAS